MPGTMFVGFALERALEGDTYSRWTRLCFELPKQHIYIYIYEKHNNSMAPLTVESGPSAPNQAQPSVCRRAHGVPMMPEVRRKAVAALTHVGACIFDNQPLVLSREKCFPRSVEQLRPKLSVIIRAKEYVCINSADDVDLARFQSQRQPSKLNGGRMFSSELCFPPEFCVFSTRVFYAIRRLFEVRSNLKV